MLDLIKTADFDKWLTALKDVQGQAIIARRILRLATGHDGDVKAIGGGVSELRIHYGPGYRVYLMRRGKQLVILLCGGDKGSQRRDIEKAIAMAKVWEA